MTGLAVPMAIGRVCLDDGRDVLGFLCGAAAVRGAADITRFGGWRSWIGRHAAV
jgi:allophanate hydrolase